ncbi:MAG: DMT family transporter [Actinomycetota bacterium]
MEASTETRNAHAHAPGWAAWSLLTLGVIAASVSAILIRYASDADALAISFWRCAAGAVALAPFARFGAAARWHVRTSLLAGAFLALHFAAWITSVEMTTVAESVLLVSTTPVFAALAARCLFAERLAIIGWVGIALAIGGAAVVGLGGGTEGQSSLLGNILALVGGVAAAGYLMAGGVSRRGLGIIEYGVIAYAASAFLLLIASAAGGAELWGYGATTWWAIVGIIVGPQLLGHTVINLVLKDIDATTVSVAIMAEPIIASALALVLFDEVPSLLAVPGGAAILAGIYLVSSLRRAPPAVIVE